MSISKRITEAAQSAAQTRATAAADTEQHRAVTLIKAWQAYRLSKSYADLLATPRYRESALFFLQDLYGPGDHAARDGQLARVIPALTRFLPAAALGTICEAIELDALSEMLDNRLAAQLRGRTELLSERFDRSAYGNAYRIAGTPAERSAQLVLVGAIGRSLDRLVRKPVLGGLLTSMGPAARAAGVGSIHEFLQRGFRAFKAMGGATEFLQLIDSRERRIAAELDAGNDTVLPE